MSLNKKLLIEETKKAHITPPVRRVNKNIQPSFFMDSTSLLPENFAQPMPPMYEEGGDVKAPGDGWEYKQAGEEFLTRRQGGTDWITAKGAARDAIQSKIFAQPQITATPTSPVEVAQIKNELKSYDPQKTGNADYTRNIQRKLVNAGYDLGGYGPNKDGVDGAFGNATKTALESFNSGISPEFAPAYIRPTKKTRETQIKKDPEAYSKFTIAKNLEPGILPTLYSGTGTEGCVPGQQCSANASIKMGNLLGDAVEGGTEALWGKNAWFQKDYLLNNGGDLLYETGERNVGLMAQVPPETYANYQVGDHVQLNRADTPSSKRYAAETSEYKNENIEHQGFIIGKASDGTPLIWHGSEDGTAYIQRMDEDLFLDTSHGKLNYKIASIVRGSAMKNADKDKLRALQNSSYYSPINEDNILVPNKNASLKQKQMAEVVNSSIGEFKSLGYNQDDLTYISQLLVGGIMDNETSSGESMKAYPKEVIAVMTKNLMSIDPGGISKDGIDFKKLLDSDPEASRGIYQLKPEMNFKDKDGKLNKMGKELEKMGVSFNDIASSSEAQTKAGALMMLNYYANLKKDPDFDVETNLYKGKIPASYLLAKSWQQGGGWYKKEKFSDLINNLDVDYSWSALEGAVDNIAVGDKQKDIKAELRAAKQVKEAQDKARYEKERVDYFNSAEGQAAYARQQEKDKAEAEWAKYNSPSSVFYQQPAESTNVNTAPMPQFKRPVLFDEGGPVHSHPHKKGDGFFSYGNNADYFDSHAVYSDNLAYNEQIRKRVYSGNWAFNPDTQQLKKLGKAEQVSVNPQVNRWATQSKKELEQERKVQASHQRHINDNRYTGLVDVQIPKEAAWNPAGEEYAGQTVKMTKDQAEDFRNASMQHNMREVYNHPLWSLPGQIATVGGGGAGVKALGGLKPAYAKAFASTKLLDRGIRGVTANAPKLQGALLKGSKYANINNMGFATSVGAEIPLINRFAKDPNWTNAGMLAYNTWGLVPGVGYSKNIAKAGKRYTDNVISSSRSAGKIQLPNPFKRSPQYKKGGQPIWQGLLDKP